MKKLTFEEVAKLINHSGITEIDLQPTSQEAGKWSLFHGLNKIPPFKYDFFVLYLHSDFTKDSAYTAAKAVKEASITQVVYAPSIWKANLDELKKHIRGNVAGIRDTKEYLISFIQNQLSKYNEKLNGLSPTYFIAPAYETPSGFKRKYPNPLYSFLNNTVDEITDGALAVLLAEPGQGKTYSTQYLELIRK